MSLDLNATLDRLHAKTLGDQHWFGLSDNNEVVLRPRVLSGFGQVKEWYSRTFTDDSVRLKNRFQAIFHAAEEFLLQEQDPTVRNDFINKNIRVLNQIYWSAQKMATNGRTGFEEALEIGEETEKLMLAQMSESELISAHLPKRIYEICEERGLITARDLECPDRIRGGDVQIGFVHGATKAVAFFDEMGRDYIAKLNVPKTFLDGKPQILYTALCILKNYFPDLQIRLIEKIRALTVAYMR